MAPRTNAASVLFRRAPSIEAVGRAVGVERVRAAGVEARPEEGRGRVDAVLAAVGVLARAVAVGVLGRVSVDAGLHGRGGLWTHAALVQGKEVLGAAGGLFVLVAPAQDGDGEAVAGGVSG